MYGQSNKEELLRLDFVFLASDSLVNMTMLCKEFHISRKTGYKWLGRYKESGLIGLKSRSHRPLNSPSATKGYIVEEVIRLRHLHPYWGPKKLQELLRRERYRDDEIPSISTITRVLKRTGLSESKGRGRPKKYVDLEPLTESQNANHIWTVDHKGWWKTKDGGKCEPLTIQDLYSRYIICAKPLKNKSIKEVKKAFEEVFEKYGLPDIIKSDNGTPFASVSSVRGLTQLSAWWLSLGIKHERIMPGHPEQNGNHERMHLDMAREIESNPASSVYDEERRLEYWRNQYNYQRPHEALNMKTPSDVYRISKRVYKSFIDDYEYPTDYQRKTITNKGYLSIMKNQVFISESIKGADVGLDNIDVATWNVWYCNLLLGQVSFSANSTLRFVGHAPNQRKKTRNLSIKY